MTAIDNTAGGDDMSYEGFDDPLAINPNYMRGLIDGRKGHPVAELTIIYLHGYKKGEALREERKESK